MFEIVIAQCPKCGKESYGFDEESAIEKYNKHLCYATIAPKKLSKILKDIVEGKWS